MKVLWSIFSFKDCLFVCLQEGDRVETQKKILFCFRSMSRCFTNPAEAEENFQTLDQLKDSNMWKLLSQLIDPVTSSIQAHSSRVRLYSVMVPLWFLSLVISLFSGYELRL